MVGCGWWEKLPIEFRCAARRRFVSGGASRFQPERIGRLEKTNPSLSKCFPFNWFPAVPGDGGRANIVLTPPHQARVAHSDLTRKRFPTI